MYLFSSHSSFPYFLGVNVILKVVWFSILVVIYIADTIAPCHFLNNQNEGMPFWEKIMQKNMFKTTFE